MADALDMTAGLTSHRANRAGSIMHATASDIDADGLAKCDLLHNCLADIRWAAASPIVAGASLLVGAHLFLWQHQDCAADRNSDYDASGNQVATPFSRSVGESRAHRGRGDRHPRAGEAQQ